MQVFPMTVIIIYNLYNLSDPFGGDPFKEADPFRTSSEDFFKKPSKPDPFSNADPFSKSATLPSKVHRCIRHIIPRYSQTCFWTFSSLVSCRVIISQVTTPSAPPAPNQKAKVLFACVSHLFSWIITSPPHPFFEDAVQRSASSSLHAPELEPSETDLVSVKTALFEGHARGALHNSSKVTLSHLVPSGDTCVFFSKGHSDSSVREHVWRSCQKSSHAIRPLAGPFGCLNDVKFLCCFSKWLMQPSGCSIVEHWGDARKCSTRFFFSNLWVEGKNNKDNKVFYIFVLTFWNGKLILLFGCVSLHFIFSPATVVCKPREVYIWLDSLTW